MEKRIEELALMLKKGSKIHIKKENRGKFTDYCGGKVTSECISRGKNSPDPKIRKRATFAANARKWKHADGGVVDSYQPSQTIVDYIKSTEGFKPMGYKDGNGVWSIGYGFTGEQVRKLFKNGITKKQADEYLKKRLKEMIPMLKRATPNWENLNQNQKDSLLSYYYNIGHGGYTRKSPKLQSALKNGDYDEVAKQIDFGMNDRKNPGLRKRRLYEQNLFLTPVNSEKVSEQKDTSIDSKWTPYGHWSPYTNFKRSISGPFPRFYDTLQAEYFTGSTPTTIDLYPRFYKKGGKVQTYANGNTLVYNPLGASDQNAEVSSYGTLTYKPFVKTEDSIYNFIYDGFKPSFMVEPVNTYSKNDKKENESENENVDKVEIDVSGPEVIQQPETSTITAPADSPKVITPQFPKGTVIYKTKNMNIGNMQELINLMIDEGISFRVTSGYRFGAKTKNGKPSHHGAGNAIDITPIEGQTWDDLLSQMRRSNRFLDYMRSHKLGILDERSKEMLAQTGGTGAHFHIGPDGAAVANFEKLFA